MKAWKVIFATLVIFAAGAVTGGLFVRSTQRPPPPPLQADPLLYPHEIQPWFLGRMQKELDLTPEQQERVGKIFAESRERMKIMFDIISPELKAELRHVHDRVRSELTPEQQERFEKLLKRRPRKPSGGSGGPPPGDRPFGPKPPPENGAQDK